ncbi:flotillin family protein [Verrucomicrobiales bacterium]|nr:flotillin family protein [Verrucomicrobiales bacterium]
MDFALILTVSMLIIMFGMVIFFFSRYQKCPSDRILVVYGKTGGGGRSSMCLHGGAAFVWPVIQGFEYLDLTPISIDIPLDDALSKEKIKVDVNSSFTVGISTEPGVMSNAAERLLGQPLSAIETLVSEIIFGQMRVVIAKMDIESFISDRDQFIQKITEGVEGELQKVGLKLMNVNIMNITDEEGQIAAISQSKLNNKPAMIWDSNRRKERILKTLESAKKKGCNKSHYISSTLNIWDMNGRPVTGARVILSLDNDEIVSEFNKSDQEGSIKIELKS